MVGPLVSYSPMNLRLIRVLLRPALRWALLLSTWFARFLVEVAATATGQSDCLYPSSTFYYLQYNKAPMSTDMTLNTTI
jgi:hypothetical protein